VARGGVAGAAAVGRADHRCRKQPQQTAILFGCLFRPDPQQTRLLFNTCSGARIWIACSHKKRGGSAETSSVEGRGLVSSGKRLSTTRGSPCPTNLPDWFPSTCHLLNRFVLTIGAIGSATPIRPQKKTTYFLFIATYNRRNASRQMVAGIHVQRNTKRIRRVEQEQSTRWREKHVRMSETTPVLSRKKGHVTCEQSDGSAAVPWSCSWKYSAQVEGQRVARRVAMASVRNEVGNSDAHAVWMAATVRWKAACRAEVPLRDSSVDDHRKTWTVLLYSRSLKNPALQLFQKSAKSASEVSWRPIWHSFATVGVRDF